MRLLPLPPLILRDEPWTFRTWDFPVDFSCFLLGPSHQCGLPRASRSYWQAVPQAKQTEGNDHFLCPVAPLLQRHIVMHMHTDDGVMRKAFPKWIFFFFFVSLGLHPRHMEVPRLGVESELKLPAYTTAHGNAGSLTHWVRPGIEPEASWFLVGFISTGPRWELPFPFLNGIIWSANPFHFVEANLSFFFFCHLWFGVINKKWLRNEIWGLSCNKMRFWIPWEEVRVFTCGRDMASQGPEGKL